MQYSSSNWKHRLRSGFYNFISPEAYITIMPVYYKIFNPKRRSCTYSFSVEDNGYILLSDEKTRFRFVGYRRLHRYVYPDGLERVKTKLKEKYCIPECKIEQGDIVVEIGANVGEFTLMASEKAKKIFSFDPDPDCFYCLNENTRNLPNVEVIKAGASNETCTRAFYLSSEDADSSLIVPKTFSGKIEIDTIRLDTWMQTRGITKIDFLKLEAEGAEIEVLEGLGGKIDSVSKISVDGGPERFGKPTFNEVNLFLKEKGFTTLIRGDHVFAWR